MQAVVAEALDAVPREFNRVIQRELEGKIKNDEMLSSELEDASFDYYRCGPGTKVVPLHAMHDADMSPDSICGGMDCLGMDIYEHISCCTNVCQISEVLHALTRAQDGMQASAAPQTTHMRMG